VLLAIMALLHIRSTSSNLDDQAPNDSPGLANEPSLDESQSTSGSDTTPASESRNSLLAQATATSDQTSGEASPPEVLNIELDRRLASEPRDPIWAPQMESILESVVISIGRNIEVLNEVRCATTVCRAIVTHQSAVNAMGEEVRRDTVFLPLLRGFAEVTRPLVRQYSDRLNSGYAAQIIPDPRLEEERWVTVFYLSGPALADDSP
jgi:hypothetical protein